MSENLPVKLSEEQREAIFNLRNMPFYISPKTREGKIELEKCSDLQKDMIKESLPFLGIEATANKEDFQKNEAPLSFEDANHHHLLLNPKAVAIIKQRNVLKGVYDNTVGGGWVKS